MSRERFVFPLYGACLATHETGQWPARPIRLGALAAGLDCVTPSFVDWRFLQPSEATDMTDVWEPDDHLPWPCIVASDGYSRESAQTAAEDAARALRLAKAGWFLDPALSEVIHDVGNGRLTRAMGAYRMLYHDEDAAHGRPPREHCLQLSTADFTVDSPLQSAFKLLRQHRGGPAVSAEMALEAFGRSYGCKLAVSQRIVLLSLAMEVALGPHRGISGQAPLAARLRAALTLAGMTEADETADWFAKEIRYLRNDVAHGRSVDEVAHEATVRRLTDLVRAVLLRYLVFSRDWIAGTDADCMFAFNTWLSHMASKGITDEDRGRYAMPTRSSTVTARGWAPVQALKRWISGS
jgi:hypothetical protein